MGSKGTNALSPALHQAINYAGDSKNIYESSCSLEFTANNKNIYKLTRKVKPSDKSHINEILIDDGTRTISKFVHSPRDHGDQGFYNWLAEVNGLEIFNVESINGDSIKPLYMQNIFSLAFVEQTKGWSDIFSMMPIFGIKDPKQKVVEYCLALKSLELNFKLDQIKSEKSNARAEWKKISSDLDYRVQKSRLYLSGFDKNSPISEEKINQISVVELDEDETEITLNKLIELLNKKITESKEKLAISKNKNAISKSLIDSRDKIKKSIVRYLNERSEASFLYEEEKLKLKNYKEALSSAIEDIQGFQDVRKISIARDWEALSDGNCSVCGSSVENKKDAELSERNIEKSIAFLKSQKSTYETYTEASEVVIDRYKSALSYYDKKITLKRIQLDNLHDDLSSPALESVRGELLGQTELTYRLNDINEINTDLETTKEKMKGLSKKYFSLIIEEKKLKSIVSSDEDAIQNFKSLFISRLNSFGYKSNGVKHITINGKNPHRLMPIVYIDGQEPQYIRYVSSASDFVRSIWSYYLCLLEMGGSHPGFLVMDEPGQHQMRVDSMKELLSQSCELQKQVILAISQDRDYDKKGVNISTLIDGIDPEKIHIIRIQDKTNCIAPL